ncbi:MAG: M23 family metallopeptidase, partial [Bacteroidota bacterium]|nr:M23 family metallopeptidase [Bacteroidota bacterium]MDX5430682.1 M23 family metallopeptidase [Bacteroidota bacterium]MDX5469429.1 M23 family metallopeptidase [Bacteroidota bacterium]
MGYKNRLFCMLIGLVCLPFAVLSQSFQFPLDTVPLLSGTFGEFRGTHIHAGIDIKTYQKTGLPVYATADGYVSRIKISPYGYGKAIYLTHHDGFTSVYGHLSGFNPSLETYIRKHQYQKRSYSVELFPGKEQFPVKKGDLIAYTGNSGGSYAPHLHFELRDSRTQEIIDPLGFRYPVTDTLAPELKAFQIVSRNRTYKLNSGFYPVIKSYTLNGQRRMELELPPGEYGFVMAAQDWMTGDTSNVLGVHEVQVMEGFEPLYRR